VLTAKSAFRHTQNIGAFQDTQKQLLHQIQPQSQCYTMEAAAKGFIVQIAVPQDPQIAHSDCDQAHAVCLSFNQQLGYNSVGILWENLESSAPWTCIVSVVVDDKSL
jgi:hypothetical protein